LVNRQNTLEEIDNIISVEILDPSTDQLLFDIVTTNMVVGTYSNLNRLWSCMTDVKCTKRFLKDFTYDTITNVDGYPIYLQRNTDNGNNLQKMLTT
jgi:hypothetical protein